MTKAQITADETRLSLQALSRELKKALPYSYGYDGAPAYISLRIKYFYLSLNRLVCAVNSLERAVPAHFYKRRQNSKKRSY